MCEKCKDYEGHSTTHYNSFSEVFEVSPLNSSTMTEAGTAICKSCGQKIEYDYDETLIPKLRIEFLMDRDDKA